MNSFFSTVLEWFKKIFGVSYEEKSKSEIATDFGESLSVTALLAERLSKLTLVDGAINVLGDNARAQLLDEIAKKFYETTLNAVAQVCLGSGDCIVKPNTDGVRFGFDIVSNEDFVITDSIGDFVYGLIVRCDVRKNDKGDVYERYEYHKLTTSTDGVPLYTITQSCFKNGTKYAIESDPVWSKIKEVKAIPNVDRLLLARFKCPKLNRKDINSPNGVPITFGASEIVEEVKESWRRYNREMNASELMIFADKSLFKTKTVRGRDRDGNITSESVAVLPSGKERVIMSVNGSRNIDNSAMIHEFAPSIRDTSLENGLELNLKMLELFCGLDEGILSKSDKVYQNTDTIRKSVQNTFAFITTFRNVLENGINELLYALDMIANVNEMTPQGTYLLKIDWSDEFAQSYAERFNELMQGQSLGVVKDEELRAWIMGEDLEVSREQLGI